jgi:glutathione peroxidase
MEGEYSFFKTGVDKFTDVPSELSTIAVKDIDGSDKTIGDYLKDKKAVLIVNVASACGYTDGNYRQLMELYNSYKDKGLEILAFPCNQFGKQESKCELDIKSFAKDKFSVTFPMFSKIEVNGENTHPLYAYLRSRAFESIDNNGFKYIPWNFSKFLIDSDGKQVNFYPSNIDPKDIAIDIEKII